MKPRPLICTVVLVGVLAASALIAWLATRGSFEPQRIAEPDSAVGEETRRVEAELAVAPPTSAPRRLADGISEDAAPLARVRAGRVVFVDTDGSERAAVNGRLLFTERQHGAVVGVRELAFEDGGFDPVALEPGTTWTLECAAVDDGKRRGVVPPAAKLVFESGSASAVVARLASTVPVDIEVGVGIGFDPAHGLVVEGVFGDDGELASVQHVALGRLTRVEAPPGVTHLLVRADGCHETWVPVPAPLLGAPTQVVLDRSGRLVARLRGFDEQRIYTLFVSQRSTSERREFDGDTTSVELDDLDPSAGLVLLIERESGALVDAAAIEFTASSAFVDLAPRQLADLRPSEIVLRTVGKARLAHDPMVELAQRLRLASENATVTFESGSAVPYTLRWDEVEGAHVARVEVAPGVFDVASSELHFPSPTIAVGPGESRIVDLEPIAFARVFVSCRDLETGERIDAWSITWTSGSVTGSADVERSNAPPVGSEEHLPWATLPARDARLQVAWRAEGREGRSGWLGPFDFDEGEHATFDIERVQSMRRIVFTGASLQLMRSDWSSGFRFVDEAGVVSMAPLSRTDNRASTTLHFASNAERLLIVPPVHPARGPLVCGWVEFDEQGEAKFELVPLLPK